jgi:hypothetical protein
VNALCITSLQQLFEYAADLQKRFNHAVDFKQNVVVGPEYLSPYVLTQDYADILDKAIAFVENNLANPEQNTAHFGYMPSFERWKEILPFLKSISQGIRTTTNVSHLRKNLVGFLDKNDQTRGKSFAKIFPEYTPFIESIRSGQ